LLEQGREILDATERLAIATKKTHSGWEPVFNIAIDSILSFDTLVPKLQLGNPDDEALASRNGKLEFPSPNAQTGAWELAQIA
jgi:hypothetical protein